MLMCPVVGLAPPIRNPGSALVNDIGSHSKQFQNSPWWHVRSDIRRLWRCQAPMNDGFVGKTVLKISHNEHMDEAANCLINYHIDSAVA